MTARIRQLALSILVISLALCAGCGGGEKTARLTGKVTYKDKAVSGGMVTFANEGNTKNKFAKTDAEGKYTVEDLPYGKLSVGVEPAPQSPMDLMPKGTKIPGENPNYSGGGSGGTYVNIPAALRNPETSKITVTIDGTTKTFDIPLK